MSDETAVEFRNPDEVVRLDVVEWSTQAVVHTVAISAGTTDRDVERTLRGMLINMDTERFGVREVTAAEAALDGVKCSWWALCPNPATQYRPHPILGDVPICASCDAKVAAL